MTFSAILPYRYTSGMKMASCGVVADLSICGYSLFIRSSPASFGLDVFTPKPRLYSKFCKQIMKIEKGTLVNCNNLM
jgi:hypothetical protein